MRYLILCVLLGVALADNGHHDDHDEHPEWHGCGPLQRLKVLQQWNYLIGVGSDRVDFGVAIYRSYFKIMPEVKEHYDVKDVEDDTSPRFRAMVTQSLVRLDNLLSSLTDETVLQDNLKHTAAVHNRMHLPHDALTHFGEALEHIIPARLGRCFDLDAWAKCYTHINKGLAHYRTEAEHHDEEHH